MPERYMAVGPCDAGDADEGTLQGMVDHDISSFLVCRIYLFEKRTAPFKGVMSVLCSLRDRDVLCAECPGLSRVGRSRSGEIKYP